ncbi:hypothetical protein LTS10_004813 [Elasticomyces elasticus]|nr:hypothetical protein LTS10_004813 [Elasticomyces elasticus]
MDKSNLARTPTEIRDMIWTLSLDTHEPLIINQSSVPTLPALAGTCQEIRKEASERYYTRRTVIIQLPSLNDGGNLERATKETVDRAVAWIKEMPTLPHSISPCFEVRFAMDAGRALQSRTWAEFQIRKSCVYPAHSHCLGRLAALLMQKTGKKPLFVCNRRETRPIGADEEEWWTSFYKGMGFAPKVTLESIEVTDVHPDADDSVMDADSSVAHHKTVTRSRRDSFQERMERLRND